jgi:hypothetical protein
MSNATLAAAPLPYCHVFLGTRHEKNERQTCAVIALCGGGGVPWRHGAVGPITTSAARFASLRFRVAEIAAVALQDRDGVPGKNLAIAKLDEAALKGVHLVERRVSAISSALKLARPDSALPDHGTMILPYRFPELPWWRSNPVISR